MRSTVASVYDPARNNFDFLRFVLAAAVLWTHSYSLAGAVDPVGRLDAQLDVGRLAVDGFFVISGFLVTQSWHRSATTAAFVRKRALPLLPALLVALGVSALVIGPLATRRSFGDYLTWSRPWLVFPGVLLHRFLAVPGVFPGNVFYDQVNASVWTLRYEFACYALVAAAGVLAARARLLVLVAVFAASWLAGQRPYVGGADHWLPHFASYFAAGMLLYELRAYVPLATWSVLLAAGAVTGGFAAGYLNAVLPLFGSYLLLAAALSRRLPAADFGRRGDFSYGLYLYAYPIQQLILHLNGGHANPLLVLGVAFPSTLVAAVLSWRWVEAPALALKRVNAGSSIRGRDTSSPMEAAGGG